MDLFAVTLFISYSLPDLVPVSGRLIIETGTIMRSASIRRVIGRKYYGGTEGEEKN